MSSSPEIPVTPETPRRRAGVRGAPIEHSLSPVLHQAAYRQLGLTEWSYDRMRLEADELAAHVAGLDDSWRGLSLTMPLKEAAFEVVHTATALSRLVGAINTVVRDEHGWSGHNTDVHGIVAALLAAGLAPRAGLSAAVVGAGATARSALAALAELGVRQVRVMVRDTVRPETTELARQLGLQAQAVPIGAWPERLDVVVGTVPGAAYGSVGALPPASPGGVVLDCVYGHGPSPLLRLARQSGYAAVPGTEMLLHQACEQVRLMTGRAAPTEAMRAALLNALGGSPERLADEPGGRS